MKNTSKVHIEGEGFFSQILDSAGGFFTAVIIVCLSVATGLFGFMISSSIGFHGFVSAGVFVVLMTAVGTSLMRIQPLGANYTVVDIKPGTYANLVRCYFNGVQYMAMICPLDDLSDTGKYFEISVSEAFWVKFNGCKNQEVRFVTTHGQMTEDDHDRGIVPVVYKEVLIENSSIVRFDEPRGEGRRKSWAEVGTRDSKTSDPLGIVSPFDLKKESVGTPVGSLPPLPTSVESLD